MDSPKTQPSSPQQWGFEVLCSEFSGEVTEGNSEREERWGWDEEMGREGGMERGEKREEIGRKVS